ncbi:MAG: hypothetical protein OEZ48_07285 [Candidatus Bathyarchaeota archaeon]|nr:hypothetical protein [Candidatus Bathyarchaeota archaeon]
MKKTICLAALLILVAAGFWIFHFNQQSQLPTVVIDGVTWTQVLHWSFKDGSYPDAWGWGQQEILDGARYRMSRTK